MRDHFLYPLFCKLRPKDAQLDDARAIQPFVEFYTVLYISPFAIAGLVW